MAYENCCAGCTYLNENCWCEKKGENHNGNDPKCNSFCEAYSRMDSARSNLYESKPSYSGCYLTTIMCKLLGYPDNNYYLNTLRKFRDNVMQTNPNYLPLLLTYDVVGPVISQKLAEDKEIAMTFFNNYITKAVIAIEEGKNQTAINMYTAMTGELADKYQITIPVMEVNNKGTDPSTLGHGRVRKPTINC